MVAAQTKERRDFNLHNHQRWRLLAPIDRTTRSHGTVDKRLQPVKLLAPIACTQPAIDLDAAKCTDLDRVRHTAIQFRHVQQGIMNDVDVVLKIDQSEPGDVTVIIEWQAHKIAEAPEVSVGLIENLNCRADPGLVFLDHSSVNAHVKRDTHRFNSPRPLPGRKASNRSPHNKNQRTCRGVPTSPSNRSVCCRSAFQIDAPYRSCRSCQSFLAVRSASLQSAQTQPLAWGGSSSLSPQSGSQA